MNRTDIKNLVITWSHRSDIDGVVDSFLNNTNQRLVKRLGIDLEFTGQTATNIISDNYPEIYLYGSLRELSIYTGNEPAAAAFDQLYNSEVSRLNITANTEGFDVPAPVMLSEEEQEIIANAP